MLPSQHLNDEIESTERTPADVGLRATDVIVVAEESLNAVIANQARTRSVGELWATAAGGGMNALLVFFQFPSLKWLAAGFAGVAAYGAWGLLDRSIRKLKLENRYDRTTARFLWLMRGTVGVAGWTAAAVALARFMAAALGGWIH